MSCLNFNELFISFLKVFQALLIIVLAIFYDLNKLEEQRRADIINSSLVGLTVITVVVNVVLSVFEMREVPPIQVT